MMSSNNMCIGRNYNRTSLLLSPVESMNHTYQNFTYLTTIYMIMEAFARQ